MIRCTILLNDKVYLDSVDFPEAMSFLRKTFKPGTITIGPKKMILPSGDIYEVLIKPREKFVKRFTVIK
jgi:hypothetical protein